jgi:hypothetical protein
MKAVRIVRLARRRASFGADRRGAAAFELVIVYPVLLIGVLFPLADVAIAGFQYISARQALRAFGQAIQYSPPADLGNTSSWEADAVAKADPSFPIDDLELLCGDGGAACSAINTAIPRYYSFSTTITLSPLVLSSVLCSSSCTYTLSYSQRFF